MNTPRFENDKLELTRVELLKAVNQQVKLSRHAMSLEARREFEDLIDALESSNPEEICWAIWDGPLGCDTPSSHFDDYDINDKCFQFTNLTEELGLITE